MTEPILSANLLAHPPHVLPPRDFSAGPCARTHAPWAAPNRQQHASDQWYTATAGVGAFHLKIDYKPARHESLTIEQFDLLKVIGKGSFGKVMQVRKKDTHRIYALKTIRKANIASRPGEITHILAERTVLALVNNPFIVPLKFSFQTETDLYLVTDFKSGGELFWHLQKETRFSEERARFYVAELVLALEHLHKYDIVYR